MKIPSLRVGRNGVPPATHMGLERVLGALKSVQPAEGLEARITARLEARVAYESAAIGRRRFYGDAIRMAWSHVATPAATLALAGVFLGAVWAARETSIATQAYRGEVAAVAITQQAPSPARVVASSAPTRLATASARRKPAAQIAAGRHRARAAMAAEPHSR